MGVSQRSLARRAGVATATIGRVEQGDPGVQLNTLVAVAAAAGVDIVVRAFPGATPSLRDSHQLADAESLIRQAHASWRPALEVPAGEFGRSADLVFFGPEEILHVEIETLAVDFQAQYRSARAKRGALAAQHQRPVRLILAFADRSRNREAVRAHARVMFAELPAGSREVLSALRNGTRLGQDGLLWVRRGAGRASGSSMTPPGARGGTRAQAVRSVERR